MKKRALLLLAILGLTLSGCGDSDPEPVDPPVDPGGDGGEGGGEEPYVPLKKNVEVTMVSHFGEEFAETEVKDTALYDDAFFTKSSYDTNYDLATLSAMAAGSSYVNKLDRYGKKVEDFLTDTGFTTIKKNTYYASHITLENSMGAIIGQKRIDDEAGKKYTLLAVFPRNAGYADEWTGNFNMGANGIHEGFLQARDEMLRFMKKYINDNQVTGDVKVWTAGYSRGAAVANLFGGYLSEDSGYFEGKVTINPQDVYVYTIGTPNVIPSGVKKSEALNVSGAREGLNDTEVPAYTYHGTDGVIDPSAENYKSVHNFVAYGDYITKLPPESWGFSRYGTTEKVTYGSSDMLAYLSIYSEEAAEMFSEDKNYVTPIPTKTFDFETMKIVDAETEIAPDAFMQGLVDNLISLPGTRENYNGSDYQTLLASATSIFGIDGTNFYNNVSDDISGLVKMAVLNYAAYALEDSEVEEDEAITNVIISLMKMVDKGPAEAEEYTDQAFLKDIFDLLINDYQNPEYIERYEKIKSLLPENVKSLLFALLDYAKDNEITVEYVDDLIALISKFAVANKESPVVAGIVKTLGGLIPDEYVSYIPFLIGKDYPDDLYPTMEDKKEAMAFDVLDAFANGGSFANAEQMRYGVLMLVTGFTMSDARKTRDLILNGCYDGNDDYEDGRIHNDPIPLKEIVAELLTLVVGKDEEGNTDSIKDAANQAIVDILNEGKTEKIEKYTDALAEIPDAIREVIVKVVFKPGEEYSFKNDLDNALTLYSMLQFLFPAHNHEMYISYLKTKTSWAVLPNAE